MSTTTTVVVVIVVLLVVLAVGLWAVRRQRTARLRERFGPEYDHRLENAGSRRAAEQELAEVADRRDTLTVRPLTASERDHWVRRWTTVQSLFVDAPADAVASARDLLPELMRLRGYPVDDFEERATLLAADHPVVVGEYRAAEKAYQQHLAGGGSSTEALRQSLVHYRALYQALVTDGDPADGADGADAVDEVRDRDGDGVPDVRERVRLRSEKAPAAGGAVRDREDVDRETGRGRHLSPDQKGTAR